MYDRYVRGEDRIAAVRGQIRELDEIALLTLQVLCADGFGRKLRPLQGRVDAVISALLMAQEANAQLPSADAVIECLLDLRLLAERDDTKIAPTRLGEALGRSALALGSANILEVVSRLAVGGAGDIDLLFNAARSAEMGDVTAWVSLPVHRLSALPLAEGKHHYLRDGLLPSRPRSTNALRPVLRARQVRSTGTLRN